MSEAQCVKCGAGTMQGPRYCPGRVGNCSHDWFGAISSALDHLVWHCSTCGYVATTPTIQEQARRDTAKVEDGTPTR